MSRFVFLANKTEMHAISELPCLELKYAKVQESVDGQI